MIPPPFPEFKPVGLEDKSFINDLTARFPPETCEINFGNLFIWRHFERSKLTLINGNLCVLCQPPSEPAYFLPPIGDKAIRETIETCLAFVPRLSRVPESFILKHGSGFNCEPDRDNYDYVYRADDLIQLKGRKYDGKRNRIRKFERSHTFDYLKLIPENLTGSLQLADRWLESKAPDDPESISVWRSVIQEACDNFSELRLAGGAIVLDGKIAAFSVGGRLTADTAVIHLEIVEPGCDGLSQLMNREFIRNEWSDCVYVNREQDNGIPGLRRAKLSYHPDHVVKKYHVWA
jgi:hypothetical protein